MAPAAVLLFSCLGGAVAEIQHLAHLHHARHPSHHLRHSVPAQDPRTVMESPAVLLDGHPYAWEGYKHSGFVNDLEGWGTGVSWTKNASFGIKGKQRMYLMKDKNIGDWYFGEAVSFNLLGKTVTFTVDLSSVPCGVAAALYFTQNWDTKSGYSGYCDIQPSAGGCFELDLLEANHLAYEASVHTEKGSAMNGRCNENGCSNNLGRYPFTPTGRRTGDLYGPGAATIDSNKPFQVSASVSHDGYASVTLLQGGRSLPVYGRALAGNVADVPWSSRWDWGSYPKPAGVPQEAAAATLKAMKEKEGVRFVASLWTSNDMDWLDMFACDGQPSGDISKAVMLVHDLKVEAMLEQLQVTAKSATEALASVQLGGRGMGSPGASAGAMVTAILGVAALAAWGRRRLCLLVVPAVEGPLLGLAGDDTEGAGPASEERRALGQ